VDAGPDSVVYEPERNKRGYSDKVIRLAKQAQDLSICSG
jgi:hypothetical protein